jgi:phage-related protein
MKLSEIEEFAKQKRKEHRMKIDKIKETARQLNQDRVYNRMGKKHLEIYSYESESFRRL